MTTYIKKVGDKFVLVDGDKESPIKVNETYRDGPLMNLPKNSANRQYLMVKKFEAEAKDGVYELTLNTREPRKLGSGDGTTRKYNWLDYLTDDEKKVYEDLKDKAIKRANDPTIKIQKEIERLQAELKKLTEAGE